jgi:hypothetical protein
MIEADRGAPQGREVKGPHNQVLLRARWIRRSVGHRPAPTQLAGPDLASGTAVSGKNRIRTRRKSFKRRRSKFFEGAPLKAAAGLIRRKPGGLHAEGGPDLARLGAGLPLPAELDVLRSADLRGSNCQVIAIGPFSGRSN